MPSRFSRAVLLALAIAAPIAARADVRLLHDELRAPELREPDLRTFALLTDPNPQQQEHPAGTEKSGGGAATGQGGATAEPSLDFDLLGEAKAPPVPAEDRVMHKRRKMLGVHQAVGLFALVPLQVATTVVGQLNYNDKFGDANTNRYKTTHAVLAYSTLAVFATNGLIALLAPEPKSMPHHGLDRVTLHKICMFTAAAGMAAQAALGIYTSNREGFENKQDFGTAHLAVGYVTLAAVLGGVSAIVF